jgi:multidrug efflux pump subunit AcrB
MVKKPSELESVPLRTGAGPTVFLRDVARVEDGADIVYNIALVDGRRTVYMPLTKRADASTLDVVSAIKNALPRMRALVPEDIRVSFEFDQSVYVKNAIRGLVTEGALGALLTALVVLLFLREWRSSLIVALTIPFAVLGGFVGVRLTGQTANIMTLGGLALAIGILVDEATVAVENIHTHLARGQPLARGVADGMREVMLPRFLSMLCVIAVFIPSFFMVGVGRALFPPLALAVGFSMVASYLLSSTLVPVLSVWLLGKHTQQGVERSWQGRLQDSYARMCERSLTRRGLLVGGYTVACVALLLAGGLLGTELFPRLDTGQFQMRIRAPEGTQLERTEDIVKEVDQTLRELLGPQVVKMTLANIGNPAWTYPVNGVYVWNSGPQEALLLVALEPEHRPRIDVIQNRLREELTRKFPAVRFSFEAGDIVSQVLNFGAPAPINITIAGNNLKESRAFSERVVAALKGVSSLQDVQIPQALDYPTLDINIDRELAGQLGASVERVGKSIVAATSSSVLVTPNFWTNPATGVPYRVALRVPENQISSIADVSNLPVMPDGAPRPLLGDIASVVRGKTYGEIDHLNNQRSLNVIANVKGNDLAKAARDVERALQSLGKPPRGSTVLVRGQVEQMERTLSSLRGGLLLAILVVLLLLTANFQSIRDSLIVLSTIPGVLGGVILALLLTRSTLNVQSMMGAIMAVGVAVANALLLVTFARDRRHAGEDRVQAALSAACARMRAILMTSVAMMAGMVPMAIGLGEGGEQTAPLGRAVIGGLFASTVGTLFILPAIYALTARKGKWASGSLSPEDPESNHFAKEGT